MFFGKSLFSADGLKRHTKIIHGNQEKFKCNSCAKTFSEKGNLSRHINVIHKSRKDHKCNSCGNSYSRADHLKKHFCGSP